MTRDDIIRMTREAGLDQWDGTSNHFASIMERFAALVAAAEREACAKACDRRKTMFNEDQFSVISMLYENEAQECAAAIRARGK